MTTPNKTDEIIEDLTNIIAKRDKKIKALEKRITFLESEEYGNPLIDIGIERAFIFICTILKRYPHNSQKMYNGQLVSTTFLLNKELLELKEKLKNNI